MEINFKEGDKVQLKSGGPAMTIDSIDESTGRANCVWFDSKNSLQTAKFAVHTLLKCDDSLPVGDIYFA